MDQTEVELESFRRQWKEEVSARAKSNAAASPSSSHAESPKSTASGSASHAAKRSKAPTIPSSARSELQGSLEEFQPRSYHDIEPNETGHRLGDPGSSSCAARKEPVSALEHYEKAAERERLGSLGDSVSLYRKAFKLDSKVHEKYRNKHFPAAAYKPSASQIQQSTTSQQHEQQPNPSDAPVTVPNTAHHSLHGLSPSLLDLLSQFSKLKIAGEVPPTDASPRPSCPISKLPEELLVEVLVHVAIEDVAAFARLAQVCKRLAYLILTEDRVWRRVVQGPEFGFAAMHYRFACKVDGTPVSSLRPRRLGTGARTPSALDDDGDGDGDEPCTAAQAVLATPPPLTAAYPTYRHMFRARPRVRFNGCYISTVNYARPGGPSANQLDWNNAPVLIVTYYRYLRLFRDGTAVSLLSTAEPADVVHHLGWEGVRAQRGAAGGDALPGAVVKDALRGRWRLSGKGFGKTVGGGGLMDEAAGTEGPFWEEGGEDGPVSRPDDEELDAEEEGTLHVETEGVVPKYMYKMAFAMGSAGRGARNNRLAWKGYWSYNKLTDDWGEFGLKNDRPFYWSRVKSYGTGM
ncbi:hypothetical protein BDY21DRAFT_419996 [Lineolata rhizophorae]|uniref:F-box domain-containing protein n=1 Tax=Lineolata rhizophorae TaxID=578093 RepID=A0A6A6P6T4_9PEZI|nr:hypothetical protein BDY21DRAFT_419996 [Lineolata rhizophorae]